MIDASMTRGLHRLVPGKEFVTLRVRITESTFTDYANITAKFLPRDKGFGAGADHLRKDEGDWLVWKDFLEAAGVPTHSPKDGDILVRAATGVSYLVESVHTDNLFDNERLVKTRKIQTGTG